MHLNHILMTLFAAVTTASCKEVITMFLPLPESAEGKVIGIDGSKTSYELYCPSNMPSSRCPFPDPTFACVLGPSTFQFSSSGYFLGSSYRYESMGCTLVTETVKCSGTLITEEESTTMSKETEFPEFPATFYPATITATELVARPTATKSVAAGRVNWKSRDATWSMEGTVACAAGGLALALAMA